MALITGGAKSGIVKVSGLDEATGEVVEFKEESLELTLK
jgi:hypothetical protein